MADAAVPSGRLFLGLMYKDALLEWRTRARLNAVLFFGLLTLLLFSFAVGPQQALLARIAPGFYWLALLLASVLSLGESMRSESEQGALEGLRLLALPAELLFLGKALSNAVFLWLLAALLLPVAMALYGVQPRLGLWRLGLTVLLGCGAISAPGTLYACIATYARARDILLPLLLFPVLVPGLLAAVKATGLVFAGDIMGELTDWLALLGAFNLVYWLLCTVLFGRVVEG